MTKAEIIRKLAKRAGITDLDAKVFFEAFLRKAALHLHPGDSVKVKGFGYFQRRTGKVKNTSDPDINKAFADLIVFYPFRSENEEGSENLIFNVPLKEEEEYNLIDSYFSISFGKPVIPLKDANLSEFYIPPVGNELKRLIENRAEKLLDESDIVENYIKGNELLLIDSGFINPNQMEIKWDEFSISRKAEDEIFPAAGQDSNDLPKNLRWDFGEDLEKQIQEESILDTSSEDKLFVDYDDLKGLSWEFGIDDEKEAVENEPEIKALPSATNREIVKEPHKPESEKPVIEKPVKPDPKSFERVKSFTTEYKIDQNNFGLTKSEMDLSWTFGEEEPIDDSELLKSITQEMNDEGFAEVKYHKRKYKFETDIIEPSNEETDFPTAQEIIPELEEEPEVALTPVPVYEEKETEVIKEKLSVHPADHEIVPVQEEKLIKILEGFPQSPERSPGYTKKKGLGIFVVSALIFVLLGSIFLYIKLTRFITPSNPGKKTELVTNNVSSVTIERNFDLPVTYPYMRDNSVKPSIDPFADNLSAVLDSRGNKPVEENKSPVESKPIKKEIPKVETLTKANNLKPVKLKEFIFQSGDKYLVQVSSWPSEPAALKHASFFNSKGFHTEIEKIYLGKGYWYRVRVGYFNSESEAEKFYNKNK